MSRAVVRPSLVFLVVVAGPALALAGPVRIVVEKATLDGGKQYAGLSEVLPASEAFTLELAPDDAETDHATVIIVPRDRRCPTGVLTADFTEPNFWGECPQHHVLEMSAGSDKILRATVPPLQVDHRYDIYVRGSSPLSPKLLVDMPRRVASVVIAHATNGLVGPTTCSPSEPGVPLARPTALPYVPTDDIASEMAAAINDVLKADPNHIARRPIQASDVLRIAETANERIHNSQPDQPGASAPPPAPAPPTRVKKPTSSDVFTTIIASVESWLADHVSAKLVAKASPAPAPVPKAPAPAPGPKPQAPAPGPNPPAPNPPGPNPSAPAPVPNPPAPAPTAPAPAPAGRSPDPQADYVDAVVRLQGIVDEERCTRPLAVDQRTALQREFDALRVAPKTLRVFDASTKLIPLTAIGAATSQDTLALAHLELKALADAYGNGPNRAIVDEWVSYVGQLAEVPGVAERQAIDKAWKIADHAAWPAQANGYVFVHAFSDDHKALALHQITAGEPITSSSSLREQLEAYAGDDPRAFAAVVAAARVLQDTDRKRDELARKLAIAQDATTAAAARLESRVVKVMTDLETDKQLRLSTSAVDVLSVAGEGATPQKGNYAAADLGAVFAVPSASGNHDLWLLPYVGLNLYFVPVDRSIPLGELAAKEHPSIYGFFQRTSLTAGLTLTSSHPDLPGYVVTGPLAGRYPLVAVGYRVSQYMRLTAGTVFYRIASNNPVNASTSLGAAPFVGVSIDADLISLVNSALRAL